MMYLLWSLPALMVIGAIASGRLNTTLAAVLGLLAAIAVALFAAPGAFGAGALGQALSRGLWIGGVITPTSWAACCSGRWRRGTPRPLAPHPAPTRPARRPIPGPPPPAVLCLFSGGAVRRIGHRLRRRHAGHRAADPSARFQAARTDGLRAAEPDPDSLGRDGQRHTAGLRLCARAAGPAGPVRHGARGPADERVAGAVLDHGAARRPAGDDGRTRARDGLDAGQPGPADGRHRAAGP